MWPPGPWKDSDSLMILLGVGLLRPHRTAAIDYSAAEEYLNAHYDIYAQTRRYFDATGEPEPIFDARRGIWDDGLKKHVTASLGHCGFALLRRDAGKSKCWSDAKIASYLRELRKLLTEAVEASPQHGHVSEIIFWNPTLREERSANRPVSTCHVDTDVNAMAGEALQLARLVLRNRVDGAASEADEQALAAALTAGRRFCIINAWTNADETGQPVGRAPLALYDTRYATEQRGRFPEDVPDPSTSRWYTFPRLTSDEVLVFSQYDRKNGMPSELWHTALVDVVDEPASPPRRSYDVRCLVVFDETVTPSEDRWVSHAGNRPRLTHAQSAEFCDQQASSRAADRAARRTRAEVRMCAAEGKADRESLLDALWEGESGSGDFGGTSDGSGANTEEASHLHLALDEETGEPTQARFVYVDEHSCIGCTYCATTARSTFFMEDDHGRARVYDQGGDSDELVAEAVDCCPVNCIHYVSHEDLIILEQEREGQFINNAQRLRSQQEATAFVPPTKAASFNSGGMRCGNCPGRGCKECPMFGVGENPVYLERVEAREERRKASGEAQREEEEQRREALIFEALSAPEAGGLGFDDDDECLLEEDAKCDATFKAIFDTPDIDVDDIDVDGEVQEP